jgi:S1-C subfamily serine protease
VTAASAPLQSGDVVLTVDGRMATSAASTRGLLTGAVFAPGVTMAVQVRRGQQSINLNLPLLRSRIPGRPWHGLEFEERAGTLRITAVQDDSPAAVAGITAEDLPLSVNGSVLAGRLDWLRATAASEVGDRLDLQLRAADGRERTATLWLAPGHLR